jgi:hypothetical protein
MPYLYELGQLLTTVIMRLYNITVTIAIEQTFRC